MKNKKERPILQLTDEGINILEEAKADLELFSSIFGEKAFNDFTKYKQRIKNAGISTDYVWHTKYTSKQDMEKILYNIARGRPIDAETAQNVNEEGHPTTEAFNKTVRGDFEYLGNSGGYDIYWVKNYEAAIDLGVNAGWCTSGRYGGGAGNPSFIPDDDAARMHFDELVESDTLVHLYHYLDPKTHYAKYALIVYDTSPVDRTGHFRGIKGYEDVVSVKTNCEVYDYRDELAFDVLDELPVDLLLLKTRVLFLRQSDFNEDGLYIDGETLIEVNPTIETIFNEDIKFIGELAFYEYRGLKEVSLPNAEKIGKNAFYGCYNLEQVSLPNVKEIGKYAFYGCMSLKEVSLPNVKEIGVSAFYGCESLKEVSLPNVKEIGKYAFYECKNLKEVSLPNVKEIGEDAFYDCESLKQVSLPNAKEIGVRAFYGCYNLEQVSLPNAEKIGKYAFYGCMSLKEVSLPNVKEIGKYAFYGCMSLKEVSLPNVKEIGVSAFSRCGSLEKIYTLSGNTVVIDFFNENYDAFRDVEVIFIDGTTSAERKLEEAKEDQQRLIHFAGNSLAKRFFELKNKNRLKSPENDIYYWLKKTPLELETRVTEIENTLSRSQERKISKLDGAELVAKNSDWKVYRIDTHNASCFYGKGTKWCTAGKDSTYFDNYKEQGIVLYYIISDNKKYAIALYPEIIDALQEDGFKANFELFDEEDNAIGGNEELEKILNKFPKIPNVELIFEFLPAEIKGNVLIRVYPRSSGEFIIPDSVRSIGNYAFSDCTSLTSITIPSSVTSIGNNAFFYCTSLTSITIPSSVTSIGDGAFYGCSSLTSITIPSSVRSIGNNAFFYCTSLTSITIPSSVISIGDGAFGGCTSLTSITIQDGVTSIGDEAFYGCSSLTSIIIPDSVRSIGNYAFGGCTSLTSITIPSSVTSIGNYAFGVCTSLTSITIPSSVTSIGDGAFKGCTSLTSITIPSSVTSIGNYAFFYCTSLTSITIPDSVTSIGDGAFGGCTSLTSITIPSSVISIGNYAFSGCSRLTSITIPDSVRSIGNYAFFNCHRLTIYAEAESKPERWHQAWNPGDRPIIWNYKENSNKRITENTLMETLLEVLNEAKEEVPVEEQQKEIQLEKKYEITTEAFTNISGVTVYRIKSLKNFAGIQKGELGGYIESEDNLSHSGNCWVKDNAMVYSGGRVEQNALVSGISEVYNNALVTGQAKVDGNCYIYDNVKVGTDSTKDCTITGGVNVYGGSEVKSGLLTGSVLVYNNSIIYDKAQIKDYAMVSNSKVGGETIIYHNAKVTDVDANGFIDIAGDSILEGPISIKGKVQIYGTSRLKGSDEGITIDATKGEIHIKDNAEVQGSPTIKGHVIIEGNAKVSDKAFIGTSISDNGNLEVKGAILKRLQNTQDYITIGGYGGANYFDENIVITDNAVVQGQASIISGGVIYNKKKKKNREYKASDIVVKTHGAKVEGNAVVKGNTIVGPGVVVTNDAILDGNIYFVNSELVDKTPTYSGVDKVIDSTLSANQDTMNTKVKEDEEPIITSEELSKNENLQLIKELYFDNDKLKEYLPEEEYKDLQKLIIRDLYNKVKIDIRLIHDTLKILETSIWGMEINKFYNADNPEQLDQLIKEFYKLAPSLIIRLNKVAEIAKAAFDKLDSNKISKLDKDKKIDLFLYNRTLVDIIKLTKGLIN